jgi:hypothetical protein
MKPRKSSKRVLSAAILRLICVRASCDPRTAGRYLKGGNVSTLPRMRIEDALREEGYGHLIRVDDVAIVEPPDAEDAP